VVSAAPGDPLPEALERRLTIAEARADEAERRGEALAAQLAELETRLSGRLERLATEPGAAAARTARELDAHLDAHWRRRD
jgi:hypothetical protein